MTGLRRLQPYESNSQVKLKTMQPPLAKANGSAHNEIGRVINVPQ